MVFGSCFSVQHLPMHFLRSAYVLTAKLAVVMRSTATEQILSGFNISCGFFLGECEESHSIIIIRL
ncbi:hypothetical protein BDZ97DRAFT_1899710, partial [Flammula alnicola]